MNQSIAILPDKQMLLDVSKRIEALLPGGNKLTINERYALAQIAVIHGLDPWNGEVWYIPGRGPMIGVKGLRKTARQQVIGNFWIDFREIVDADERKRYGIDSGALAFEARLFDSENILTYCEMVEKMIKAGIPWESVKAMLGEKPYTSGIGVLKPGESTKMERVQCAMKRAEADALKRRFDVPLGLSIEPEAEPDPIGEWQIDGSQVVDHDSSPRDAYQVGESLGATHAEVESALQDAGGDFDTAIEILTKRINSRKLQNGKKQLGRDDSGL